MRIRKGDRVVIRAGNDKGKSGEVLSCSDERVIVQGANIRKKHLKRTQETPKGRIIEMETSMHVSNVSLCDKENKPIKVRIKEEKGERFLVFGTKNEVYRSMKKPK